MNTIVIVLLCCQVDMKNLTEEDREVHVRVTVVASFYTGVPSENIVVKEFNEKLTASESKSCNNM